jgi:hypothetical protein
MSAFSLVYTRALPIVKSENANIPYPAVAQTGANTAVVAAFNLQDSSATFITNNVRPGDIVYNVTDGTTATVVSVSGQQSLFLNADIFTAVSKNYIIYVASSQTTLGNYGCYLYVGVAGHVAVDTIGDDINVTFLNVPAGTILPVQVKKLRAATTATNIIALW